MCTYFDSQSQNKNTTMWLHFMMTVEMPNPVKLVMILIMTSTVHDSKNNGENNSNILVCRWEFLKGGPV